MFDIGRRVVVVSRSLASPLEGDEEPRVAAPALLHPRAGIDRRPFKDDIRDDHMPSVVSPLATRQMENGVRLRRLAPRPEPDGPAGHCERMSSSILRIRMRSSNLLSIEIRHFGFEVARRGGDSFLRYHQQDGFYPRVPRRRLSAVACHGPSNRRQDLLRAKLQHGILYPHACMQH